VHSVAVIDEQNQKSPAQETPGTHPAVTTATVATASRPIAGTPSPTENPPPTSPVDQDTFVTFDSSRKYLARVVGVNRKKVTVRRFHKKTGEWLTKIESREREVCIRLTAAEAEASFPGSVGAWDKAADSTNGSGVEVTRQLSPNLAAPVVAATPFQSVADFAAAYTDEKKTIDDLTNKFVDKAGQAKQAQDEIIPHLSAMQSLLSKKGTHHHLVIAARKQGHKIPWWTDFYKGYKDRLWESLRTMERRIAAYRSDPTAPISKPERDTDSVPRLNKGDRKRLIEASHRANELVAALEANRDGKTEIASFKAVMDANRLDEIVQAHLAEANDVRPPKLKEDMVVTVAIYLGDDQTKKQDVKFRIRTLPESDREFYGDKFDGRKRVAAVTLERIEEEKPAPTKTIRSRKLDCDELLTTLGGTLPSNLSDLLALLLLNGLSGKMLPELYPVTAVIHSMSSPIKFKNSGIGSPTECLTLNSSESPRNVVASTLSDIVETGDVPQKYYLGEKACRGILRRMKARNKNVPQLEEALKKAIVGR
jgi:hypothetical protein